MNNRHQTCFLKYVPYPPLSRLHDCLMSALAMMFFQDPSLLSFLRRLEDPLQCGNLKALFAVKAIPQDSCLRERLNAVETAAVNPAFGILLQRLQRGNQLCAFRFLDGYLVACTPFLSALTKSTFYRWICHA